MYSNEQLESMRDVAVTRLAELEAKVAARRNELTGLEIEFSQLLQFCLENKIEQDNGYHLVKKTTTRRTVIPAKFAELFPDANGILLQRYSAFVNTELDKVVQSRILPSITIADAEKFVGKAILNAACDVKESILYKTAKREGTDPDRR